MLKFPVALREHLQFILLCYVCVAVQLSAHELYMSEAIRSSGRFQSIFSKSFSTCEIIYQSTVMVEVLLICLIDLNLEIQIFVN